MPFNRRRLNQQEDEDRERNSQWFKRTKYLKPPLTQEQQRQIHQGTIVADFRYKEHWWDKFRKRVQYSKNHRRSNRYNYQNLYMPTWQRNYKYLPEYGPQQYVKRFKRRYPAHGWHGPKDKYADRLEFLQSHPIFPTSVQSHNLRKRKTVERPSINEESKEEMPYNLSSLDEEEQANNNPRLRQMIEYQNWQNTRHQQ